MFARNRHDAYNREAERGRIRAQFAAARKDADVRFCSSCSGGPSASFAADVTDPPVVPTPLISPFALWRVAVLPYDDLLAAAVSGVDDPINKGVTAASAAEALRDPVERTLHEIVPSVSRSARKSLLTLRRDVHNGRLPAAHVIDSVREVTERWDRTRKDIDAWIAARQTLSACVRDVDERLVHYFCSELPAYADRMVANEAFARPLLNASPTLFEDLSMRRQHSATPRRSTKAQRSLVSYVVRAVAKTSPFSTFMHHAALDRMKEPASSPQLAAGDRTSRAYVSRSASLAVYHAKCRPPAHDRVCIVNASLEWQGTDRAAGIGVEYVTFARRLWRSERRTVFRFHPVIAEVLRSFDRPFGWSSLLDRFGHVGIGAIAADELAERLLDASVLRLVPLTHAWNEHPASGVLDALDELTAIAAAVPQASARDRFVLMRRCADRVAVAFGNASPGAGTEINTIIEEGYFSKVYGWVSRELDQLLYGVAAALRPFARINTTYAFLRMHFVETFGTGGTCANLAAFLENASTVFMALGANFRPVREAPPSNQRVPLTVFVQFAFAGEGAASSRDLLAVVDRVHPGCGWLTARHAFGDSAAHRVVRERLREWLLQLSHPREPVDIPVCGECNDLQAHPRITERALIWPTEPPVGAGQLNVHDTVLSHNPESNMLELSLRNGDPIAPLYLGGTIPSIAWGPRYWLAILGQPFEMHRGTLWNPAASHPDDVVHEERRTAGRVVLARETWHVRTSRLRSDWFAHNGSARLFDVATACRSWQLPRVVFAQAVGRPPRSALDNRRKPMWVDTYNPVCLDILERMTAAAEWITFREALPSSDTSWFALDGRTHAAELLVEMAL